MNGPMAFELRRRSAAASSAVAQDWVVRIRAGDEAAFEAMFRAYYNPLCGYVAAYLGSRAHRIASTSGIEGLESVAFRNADDGSKALIVVNTAAQQRSFDVRWAGQSFSSAIPAGAVVTFYWKS